VRDLVALLLGVLALGFALHTAWSARTAATDSRDRLAAVRREVTSLENRVRAVSARAGAGGALLARAAAASEAPPERIVAVLAGLLPEDVRVERLTVAYDDEVSLDLQLVARDAGAWDEALARLAAAESLERVVPGPERREGEIRTTVRARWRSGAR
jgi:hypothetical protein